MTLTSHIMYEYNDYESQKLREIGRNALKTLDKSGRIRTWVFSKPINLEGLEKGLYGVLPKETDFNLIIRENIKDIVAEIKHSPQKDNGVVVGYIVTKYESRIEFKKYILELGLWYIP